MEGNTRLDKHHGGGSGGDGVESDGGAGKDDKEAAGYS